MSFIRIVWGTAHGSTVMSSYDAALAAANVHNYNLVQVSSVIPDDATIRAMGTAPDLGPAGERLTVVEGRKTVAVSEGSAVAGLGWACEPSGRGIFYEVSGTDSDTVEMRIEQGLDAGRELREWQFTDEGRKIVETSQEPMKPRSRSESEVKAESEPELESAPRPGYTTAVIFAIYGESTPLL